MTNTQIQILDTIKKLNKTQQYKLLEFIETLDANKKPDNLLKLAGSIKKNDLIKMQKAIETDCEGINSNDW